MKRKNKWLIIVAVVALAVIIGALLWVNLSRKNHTISYEEFKSLTTKQQVKVFSKMTGQEVYDLVADSDQNWPVTEYDLISPNNAKETIVLKYEDEEPEFDLAWPSYGGFLPETIASLSELTGKMDVSRNGSESGYTMSYGRNKDGSYPSNSQRSIPKSTSTIMTGILDVDKYIEVAKIVTNGESEDDRLSALEDMGYDSDTAESFISDQSAWMERDDVCGPNNIDDGAKEAGHDVENRYGYHGITAPWFVDDLHLVGGSGQVYPIFRWKTLCDSGLISDTGTADIH